jgi:hypothetical protein
MGYSTEEIRDGLREGTIVFCLPAAHENFTCQFLEEFSERILKQPWLDVAFRTHLQIPALLDDGESAEDLAANIQDEYGVDVTDLPGLPFWEVIRRCARSTGKKPPPSSR